MVARVIVFVGLLFVVGSTIAARAFGDVQPGDVITKANAEQVKDLTSPGLYWCVQHGLPMRIVAPRKLAWPPAYREATEKYSPQVKLSADGLTLDDRGERDHEEDRRAAQRSHVPRRFLQPARSEGIGGVPRVPQGEHDRLVPFMGLTLGDVVREREEGPAAHREREERQERPDLVEPKAVRDLPGRMNEFDEHERDHRA